MGHKVKGVDLILKATPHILSLLASENQLIC